MEMPKNLRFSSSSSVLFIGLIILLSIFLVRNDILGNKVQFSGDARDQFLADKIIVRNAILKGVFPLWSPFLMSGEPNFPKIQLGVISINTILEFITTNVYFTMFLNSLIHLIILGIGMYLLSRTINLEPRYAFVSAIVCMLSSYAVSSMFYATFQFLGLAFMPYVFMFTIKAIRGKEWIKYSIFAGFFLSLEFLEGAFEVFVFTAMTLTYILFFNLISKSFVKRLIKSGLIGSIIFLVAFGFSAIKLLPAIELANISNRQQPFDYETSLGTHLTIENFFQTLIEARDLTNPLRHPIKGTGNVEIGIIGGILVLVSMFNFRKRNYLLFLGMLIFGLLMITNSPLVYFFWKYVPFFNKQKHVMKAQVIFLIASSVLCAYGVSYLISKIKSKKLANITYVSIAILLIITSWGFTYDIKMKTPYKELDSVDIMKYMSQDKEMFRFKAYETNGIDWGTNYYSINYGLHDIYGYVNLWIPDYLPIFLSVANREPAKFFGMLNMKYMTAMEEINISGFSFVKKFEDRLADCEYNPDATIVDFNKQEHCPAYTYHKKAWGPYLYLNERFIPRAYAIDNAILLVGNKDITKQLAYQLMLEPNFNPANSVIILGKNSINEYSPEELIRYSVIFLTQGPVDQNSIERLRNYKQNGGVLLPDILSDKNSITGEDINDIWKIFNNSYTKAEYTEINYNHYLAKAVRGNFLVLSELFSVYHGWSAKSKGQKLEILNANVMNSAVYIGGKSGEINFNYLPSSFIKGAIISLVTILLVSGYFLFIFFKNRKCIASFKPRKHTENHVSANR